MNILLKDSFYLTLSKGVRAIALLILTMLVSRYLSLEENGVFRKLNLLLTLSILIIPWGIPISISYYFKLLTHKKRDTLIVNSFVLPLIQTLLFIIIFSFIFLNIGFFDEGLDNRVLIVFVIQLIFTATFAFTENLLVASNNSKFLSIINILIYLFQTITVYFYLINIQSLSYIIIIMSVFEIIKNILIVFYYWIKHKPTIKINKYFMKEQVKYSFPVGINSIIQTVNIYIDGLFVSLLFSSPEYAIYSAGSMQIPLISIVTITLATVTLPEMSKIYNKNKSVESMIFLWGKVTILGAIVIFPVFWALLFFHKGYIEFVFSEKFYDAIPIFLIYLLRLPLSCTTFSNILLVMGKQRNIVINSILAITLNIIACGILLYYFGLIGAAIATLIMHIFVIFLQLKQIAKFTNVRIKNLLPFKKLINLFFVPGIIYLFLLILIFLLKININTFSFLLLSTLGLLITFFMYYKLGFICKEQIDIKSKVVGGINE